MSFRAMEKLNGLLESDSGRFTKTACCDEIDMNIIDEFKRQGWLYPKGRVATALCPNCCELSRVKLESDHIQCPNCSLIAVSAIFLQQWQLCHLTAIRSLLATFPNIDPHLLEIIPDHFWQLGNIYYESVIITIYFGRRLNQHGIPENVFLQLENDCALERHLILTSTPLIKWEYSRLQQCNLLVLKDVAQLDDQLRFIFDETRLNLDVQQKVASREPSAQSGETTLQELKHNIVWLHGVRYKLSHQETSILQALVNDSYHVLSKDRLRIAVGSQSLYFKPFDTFKRHPEVYEYFIHYNETDNDYHLLHTECL
jgi:hypothetical protein